MSRVLVNYNYCVTGFCGESLKDSYFCEQFCLLPDFKCKLYRCESCTICCQVAREARHKAQCESNKICERSFLCRSVVFCHICLQCLHCSKSDCRGQTSPVLENMGCPRDQSQGHKNLQGRLHHPLPEPTIFDHVSTNHK